MAHIELYEALKPSVGEDAARMIADVAPPARELATRADIAALRADLLEAQASESRVLRGEMAGLRDGLRGGMHGLRDELRGEMHGLRDGLRGEMQQFGRELRAELRAERRADVDRLTSQLEDHRTWTGDRLREVVSRVEALGAELAEHRRSTEAGFGDVKAELARLEGVVHKTSATTLRWMLTFFLPLWVGMVLIVVEGIATRV